MCRTKGCKFLVGMTVILVVGLLLTSCTQAPAPGPAPAPAPAPQKVYELKFATGLPPEHYQVKNLMIPWADMVNRESKGRIKVTVYPGGVLGEHAAAYQLLTRGTVEAVQGMISYAVEVFQLTDVMNTPFSSPNSVIGTALMNGQMFDKYFAKEFDKVKIINVTMTDSSQIFTTKKPVRKVDDLKGLRIRTSGGLKTDMMKDFGAVPVLVSTPEQYEALQKGVLDGTEQNTAASVTYRFWEVCKYVTLVNFSGFAGYLAVNKGFYDSLPRDLQLVIEYASKDMAKWSAYMYWQLTDDALKKCKAGGMELITLSPEAKKGFKDVAQGAIDKWIDGLEKKGIPMRQVYADLMAQPELYGY